MRTVLALVLAFLAVSASARTARPKSVADLVIANKEKGFGILLEAVLAADPAILEALSNTKFAGTVFAPTDDAFADLLKALGTTKRALLANKSLLTSVLQYHVLGQPVLAGQVPLRGAIVRTLLPGATGQLSARRSPPKSVRLVTTSGGSANVIGRLANLRVGRAIVHGIDAVLVPGDRPLPRPQTRPRAQARH